MTTTRKLSDKSSIANPILEDAREYYLARRSMNNPKGWRKVSRLVGEAILAGVYPDATVAQERQALRVLARLALIDPR